METCKVSKGSDFDDLFHSSALAAMEAAMIDELGSDLYAACRKGDLERAIALSSPKIEGQGAHSSFLSAMMAVAASKDQQNIVEYCVSKGGMPNDAVMSCVMFRRAINTHAYLLASKCVDPDYYIPFFGDILGVAAQLGDVEWTKLCLEHGANPNLNKIDDRKSVLGASAERGRMETVDMLLKSGADLDGSGAIILAAEAGRADMVKYLWEKGANVDEVGSDTDDRAATQAGSALHKAVSRGHESVVKLLLERGADRHLEDGQGRTPLRIAEETGKENIASLLQ